MSERNKWIDEQKKNKLFRGGGSGGDAARMLEISPTNRDLSAEQARELTAARYINDLLCINALADLCDMIEAAQLCVDGKSRENFMKVAIEQWQGKVAAGRKFSVESLV